MKLIRFLFYEISRLLVKASFGIFFSKTYVYNQQNLDYENACIPVSNHPNTLIDVLSYAAQIVHRLFFLANAGMFESRIGNWFFTNFYCIPIKRDKDTGDRKIRNDHSFDKADAHLSKRGSIYIAPQGGSEIMRRIGKIKTGTARIALSAELKNDFSLGLTILPAGISYSSQHDFRSEMIINVGPHILVAPYKDLFEKNEREAVIALTKEIKRELEKLIINTKDEEEDELLYKIDTLLQSNDPKSFDKQFLRTKNTLNQIRIWKSKKSESFEKFVEVISKYFELLSSFKIEDKALLLTEKKKNAFLFSDYLKIVFGIPFFVYGYLNNFIAAYIPLIVLKKLNLFIGYTATVKVIVGLISFSVLYFLQTYFVHKYFSSWSITLIYLTSLPLMGLSAWYYKKYVQGLSHLNNAFKIKAQNQAGFENLSSLRQQTILMLKEEMALS